MREVQWELMFPDELETRFQECPLVYFTYGLCEPHGPQNALGLDAVKAHAIACRAAKSTAGSSPRPITGTSTRFGGYAVWGATGGRRARRAPG